MWCLLLENLILTLHFFFEGNSPSYSGCNSISGFLKVNTTLQKLFLSSNSTIFCWYFFCFSWNAGSIELLPIWIWKIINCSKSFFLKLLALEATKIRIMQNNLNNNVLKNPNRKPNMKCQKRHPQFRTTFIHFVKRYSTHNFICCSWW